MFNTGAIDSLKIRVKLEKVTILDKRLITDFIAYYPDIDKLDEDGNEQTQLGDNWRKAEPYVKIINGITYRIYIKAFIDSQKLAHEYVVFQVSAKMLKERYFEGITAFNYHTIVEDINSFGVLHITKENFLQGLVSDIDICINQLIDIKSLKTAFSFIVQNPNKGKTPLIHSFNKTENAVVALPLEDENAEKEKVSFDPLAKLLEQKAEIQKTINLGLDFNKREKASNTAPYCKIYHKGFELQTKSKEFYNAYLNPIRSSVLENLVRYEFTIKAAKHKQFLCSKGFKADFKTLFDLLKADSEDLKKIAQSGLKWYIEPKENTTVSKEQSPTDIMLQYLLKCLIKEGYDNDKLLAFSYLIDCPVAKSRSKNKAKKLIRDLQKNDSTINHQLITNNRSTKFLNNLGL